MTVATAIAADSPLAWYKLNDAAPGVMPDSSGNSHPGTRTTGTSVAEVVPGSDNTYAVDFNLVSPAVVPYAAWRLTSSWSIEAWFQADGANSAGGVICYCGTATSGLGAGDRGFGMYIQANGNMGAYASHTDGTGVETQTATTASTSNFADGRVHHAVLTWDDTTKVVNFWVDNELVWTQTVAGKTSRLTQTVGNYGLLIGGDGADFSTTRFDGRISNVAFYNYALSSTQVGVHFSAGLGSAVGTVVTALTSDVFSGGTLLRWTLPPQAAGADYRINGGTATDAPLKNRIVLTGLTNSTTYTVEVRPKNANGNGNWTTVSFTPAVSTLLFDTFDRTASTTVAGTPDVGGPYTAQIGTWGIIANQLYQVTATGNAHLTVPSTTDVDMSVTFASTTIGQLMCRRVDASNYLMFGASGLNALSIWSVRGGTYNVIATFTGLPTINGMTIRGVAYKQWVYLFMNGFLLGVSQDPAYGSGGTAAGVRTDATATRYENLLIKPATAPPIADTTGMVPSNLLIATPGVPVQPPSFAYLGRDLQTLDVGAP